MHDATLPQNVASRLWFDLYQTLHALLRKGLSTQDSSLAAMEACLYRGYMHRMIGCMDGFETCTRAFKGFKQRDIMLRAGSGDESLHGRFDTSQFEMRLLKGIGAVCGIIHRQNSDGQQGRAKELQRPKQCTSQDGANCACRSMRLANLQTMEARLSRGYMHRMTGCMLCAGSGGQSLYSRFDTSQFEMRLLKGIGAVCGIIHRQNSARPTRESQSRQEIG